jgi:hypothetical protein
MTEREVAEALAQVQRLGRPRRPGEALHLAVQDGELEISLFDGEKEVQRFRCEIEEVDL